MKREHEPEALRLRRHRMEQHVKARVRCCQKQNYTKQDYDGNQEREDINV